MLYRTRHPFFFPSSSSTTISSQIEKEMECVMNLEEFCNFNPQNVVPSSSVSSEDFFVDELLNLNNEDSIEEEEEEEEEKDDDVVVKEEQLQNEASNAKKASLFLSPPLDTVLSVPAEEADLEWLSHFVEDSFSQFSTPYPAQPKPKPKPVPEAQAPCFAPPSLNKSRRSKRARTGTRVWSTAPPPSPPPSSSCTTTSPTSPGPGPGPGPAKRYRKREAGSCGGGGSGRRCSHCGVQKTPQWRTGPTGAKTLCNACGVRFKSGRLFPEYRPACSPTFSSELHSNNHRKVLEMRRKKETIMPSRPESSPYPVQSFG